MTDKKTITLTWNDLRIDAPWPGRVNVALWMAAGDDAELNAALRYAAAESRKGRATYRVHTWPTDETQWRVKSVTAHNAGRGL